MEDLQQPLNDQPNVPKPMLPQRPRAGVGPSLAGTRRHKEPPALPNFSPQAWEEIVEDTEFDKNASESVSLLIDCYDRRY